VRCNVAGQSLTLDGDCECEPSTRRFHAETFSIFSGTHEIKEKTSLSGKAYVFVCRATALQPGHSPTQGSRKTRVKNEPAGFRASPSSSSPRQMEIDLRICCRCKQVLFNGIFLLYVVIEKGSRLIGKPTQKPKRVSRQGRADMEERGSAIMSLTVSAHVA